MSPVSGAASPTGPLTNTPSARINVVDFGAKCDTNLASPSAGTDDTANINSAIAAWVTAGLKGSSTLAFPQNGLFCKVTGPLNFTRSGSNSPYGMTVDHLSIFASFSSNGPVGTVNISAAGTGGTPGTYTSVPLTGGTGSGCTATSVVVGAGGGVTSLVLTAPGCGTGYAYGDALSAAGANIGNVTGFTLALNSISGRAAVDAIGARWIHWNNSFVYGDCTSAATTPNVGMAVGRVLNGTSADNMNMEAPTFNGCYALAPLYNLASEEFYSNHPQLYNLQTTGKTYAAVLDGDNHFNWSTTFQTMTPPVDTKQSFIGVTFVNMLGQTNLNTSGGYGIWLASAKQHRFISSYIAATQQAVVLYSNTNDAFYSNTFDIHMETTALQNCFLVTGPNATPTLQGLIFIDETSQCQTSVFKADTGVTSIGLQEAKIHVDAFQNAAATIFDNAALYSGSGDIFVPASNNWNAPLNWGGRVCISAACYPIVPTQAINRNPDFVTDQKFASAANAASVAGALIVDGWRQQTAGGVGNTMTYTRTASAPPTGYAYSESIVTRNTAVPTAAQYLTMRSAVEGPETAVLGWGTANAIPATLDFCAKATNATTYTFSIQNTATTLSYLIDYAITQANVWQCFSKPIPAITSGSWNTIQDVVGLFINHSITVGSNFVGTNATWNAGNFLATSATFNHAATINNSINLAAIHLRPGYVDMSYLAKTTVLELTDARHWYLKTFNTRTAVAQNAGVTGAATTSAPYAFVTKTTFGFRIDFGQTMFSNNNNTAPTVGFYSTTAATSNCYNATAVRDSGAASAINVGDNGMMIQCTLVTLDALGDQIQVQFDVDSGF